MLDTASLKFRPRWSPDGSATAFYTGSDRIVVCGADGKDARILDVDPLTDVEGLSYSPDGYIYFSAKGTSGERDIWRVDPSSPAPFGGSDPAELVLGGDNVRSPDVSPDGRLLAYADGSSVVVARLPYSGPGAWTAAAHPGLTPPNVQPQQSSDVRVIAEGKHPRWSPDGR